jgi:hypothetical protein
MGQRDISIRQTFGVATIPPGPNSVLSAVSPSIAGGTFLDISVNYIPNNAGLTLWNLSFTIVMDSLTKDSNDNYVYQFPNIPSEGTSNLSLGQAQTNVTSWLDWATSNDLDGNRMLIIRIFNGDTNNAHVYYLFTKGYTFSTTTGGVS